MRRFVLAAFAMTVLAACQPATTELTEDQKAEIEEAVKQATRAEFDSYVQGDDIDQYMAFMSDWSVAGPFAFNMSLDSLRSGTLDVWSSISSAEVELGEMRVLVLGPDAAIVEGSAVFNVTDTSGVAGRPTNIYTWTWIRQDSQWRIVVGKFHDYPDET